MIRVVIVEDSATIRSLLSEILESDPEIRVVGLATNGAEAVEMAARLRPDLITMDIHMPVLDGFEATKQIMAETPTPILVVTSSVSGREVQISLDAIKAGALMVVSKPDKPLSPPFEGQRLELLAMVKAMAAVKVVRRRASTARVERTSAPHQFPAGSRVRLVTIVASTGGPAALQRIFSALPHDFAAPILVVQHIAVGFTSGLADWLDDTCQVRIKVAVHGESLRGGTVYLAPEGRHFGVTLDGRVALTETDPVDGFRPSGTCLFESAARVYGAALLAVILTGMGSDGVEGLKAVKAAGGRVLAQDEASSVVYGMPREAVAAGVSDLVVGLDDLAQCLVQFTDVGSHVDPHPRR
jgi:two-component system, chemotaxis family, protein-glutamate methylesterase/glutaminase